MKAACSGCSSSPFANPSIVVMSRSSARSASVMQASTRRPSMCTVQAPHSPRSQPFFVPVRPRRSRNASRRVERTSTVALRTAPLILSETRISIGGLPSVAAAQAEECGALIPNDEIPDKAAASRRSRRVQSLTIHLQQDRSSPPRANALRTGRSAPPAAATDRGKVRLVVAAEMRAVRRTEMAEAFVTDAPGNLAYQGSGRDEIARPFEPPSTHIAMRRQARGLPKRADEVEGTEGSDRSEPAHRETDRRDAPR